jgi:hypothetical protein
MPSWSAVVERTRRARRDAKGREEDESAILADYVIPKYFEESLVGRAGHEKFLAGSK